MGKIVFLKTEWMEFYDGRTGDKAPGKFSWVKSTGQAHEKLNFRRQGDYFYAYAPIAGGSGGVNLKRIDANAGDAEYLDGVDVVFIAAGPDGQGVVVVGSYRNARIYAVLQNRNGHHYLARGPVKSAKRLDVDRRLLRIEDPPRRSNVWYADGRPELLSKVRRLMAGKHIVPAAARAERRNVERCIAVERAAYDAVIRKYENLRYVVTPAWKDKVGWDLEATLGSVTLRIEVKGTERSIVRAELTPQEYSASDEHATYRICIVTDALNESVVHTFKKNFNGAWFDESGDTQLEVEPLIGARLTTAPR